MAVVLTALLVLTACSDSGSGDRGGSTGLDPSPQLTLEEADQVAQTFLDAWVRADYATMYSLISPNSRSVYSETEFSDQYHDVTDQLTLNGLQVEITGSLRQGTTAAVQYDVVLETGLFGAINDPVRTLRLIETPEGWRIAWSRMDIFDDLAEGARLDLRQTMPGRGNIYDRNGKVLVDQNGRSVAVYLTRRDIPDEAACIQLISRVFRREYADVEALFNLYLPETLFLAGELDPETYQREEQSLFQLCDVGDDANDTLTRPTRRYFGELAPHLVGYIGPIQPEQVETFKARGYPPDALVGQAGVESAFEEYLAGKPGGELVIVAPTGELIREIASVDAEPGQSVYLTIDRDLQEAVQNAFIEAYNFSTPTWTQTSPGAAGVVMNVKTGEVLAMVSYPWFDPNLFNPDSMMLSGVDAIEQLQNDQRTPLLNRVTAGVFPAGSVFKIVSTAAGLDSGVYTPDTWYTCNAVWSHPDDALPQRTDWIYGTGAHGTINFTQGLAYSCDPYFWELGAHLHQQDPNLLPNYAYKLGLGVPTGQEVLPEDPGYIPNPDDHFRRSAARWTLGETANLVIGQGEMQITPLQIVRMTAAIANRGTLYQPLFVSRIGIIGEEPVYQAEPTVISLLGFDQVVYDVIQNAMCAVTLDPYGTARYIFEEWYNFQGTDVVVCGKTGTAQTGSETTKPQAWFVAFAPQDDPEIAVAVIVENSCEGSEVAAPIVRRIVEDYYHMPHSQWPELWQTGCYALGE